MKLLRLFAAALLAVALPCLAQQISIGKSGGISNGAGANVIPKSNGTNLVTSAISDNGTSVTTTEPILLPNGTVNNPAINFTSDLGTGFFDSNGSLILETASCGTMLGFTTNGIGIPNQGGSACNVLGFASNTNPSNIDVGFSRQSSGNLLLGSGGFGDASGVLTLFQLQASGKVTASKYFTGANCADGSGAPAVCGVAPVGAVVIPAAGTTVTVNTTAVGANSRIFVQEDQSLGVELGVTCNTGFLTAPPVISAKVPSTSFTITIAAGLAVNPVCLTYQIMD